MEDDIAKHVLTFINILKLTTTEAFIHWTSSNIIKLYKWAALVAKYRDSLNENSRNLVFDIIGVINMKPLSENIDEIYNNPFYIIQKYLLSGLLSWCEHKEDILLEIIHQSTNYVGQDTARRWFVELIDSNINLPIKDSSKIEIDHVNMRECYMNNFAIILLVSLYKANITHSGKEQSQLESIINKIKSDSMSINILARALTFSPGHIVCCRIVIDSEISCEAIVQFSKSAMLWDILESYAATNPQAFMSMIDEDVAIKLLSKSIKLRSITEQYIVIESNRDNLIL
jgi:hypothetical protein